MSSCGNPSTENDALMPRRARFDRSKFCVKCKINRGNIVVRHAVYCKECFLSMTKFKFRHVLDPVINASPVRPKRKTLEASGQLLVAFSGGLGSVTVLDLVNKSYFAPPSAQGGTRHPRNADPSVWNMAYVCYVEICAAFPSMRDRTDDVRALVRAYPNFHFIPLRLEDAFDRDWWNSVGGESTTTSSVNLLDPVLPLSSTPQSLTTSTKELLTAYLCSLPTETAVTSTVRVLVERLLLQTARARACSHLLYGTSMSALSVNLIGTIARGGGFGLEHEIGGEWDGKVTRVVRPLRELGMKECMAYFRWSRLEAIGRMSVPGYSKSIDGLTEAFVVGLEKDYPSTVSTIARTCAKLAPRDESGGDCFLCARPIQKDASEWKTRVAIHSFAPSPSPPPDEAEGSLARRICYPCQTTFTSRSSRGRTAGQNKADNGAGLVALPVWVQPQPDSRDAAARRARMRETVEEFLLDED